MLGKSIHVIFKDEVEYLPENYGNIFYTGLDKDRKSMSPLSPPATLHGKLCLAGYGSGGDKAGNLDN